MYNFLFDKKSLFLLLAGMVVAGGVLFFSGLLVGVQWGLPVEAAVAPRAPQVPPKRAAFLPADRPCRPEPEARPAPAPAPAVPSPAPVAAPAPKPDLRVSVEPAPPVSAP